ncbi:MAG: outer membrane protein transport protein [Gemmataceae bacterium]|nr:outer membrane protein transport protein [Gemmataceae bacterium]
MRSGLRLGAVAALALVALPATGRAQGLYLQGGGAAHLSMGGASTATPVDAIGALYWNPAAIGRLGRSEVAVGGAFLFPNIHFDSAAPSFSGSTRSDNGVGIASDLGIVWQPEDNRLTYGLGLTSLGGGGVNFPGTFANPSLSGIGPLGNVQGPIWSNIGLLQLTPTAAYKVTDRFTFGFGPTVSVAFTGFDPAYFGGADDANGDGVGTFPTGTHSRPFWGGGVRAGLVYSVTDRVDVGFGYTSPQWFETWKYYARDELGRPRTLFLTATLPAIYSWGVGYRPTDKLLLSADLRYFAYGSTDLFGTPLKDGGLGWRDVFAVALGSRYQVTDRAALSLGYVYNDNPIPSVGTLFNVQGPAVIQHTLAVGTTVNLTDSTAASLGYAYGFPNTITGPVREAVGVGTKLTAELQQLTFTLQFKFGGCGRKAVTPAEYGCGPAGPAAADPARAGG